MKKRLLALLMAMLMLLSCVSLLVGCGSKDKGKDDDDDKEKTSATATASDEAEPSAAATATATAAATDRAEPSTPADDKNDPPTDVKGKWTATQDISDEMGAYIKKQLRGKMADYFDVKMLEAVVVYNLSLNDDSYKMSQKETEPGTLKKTMMDMYATGAVKLYMDTMGLNREALEKEKNMSWDDYVAVMRKDLERDDEVVKNVDAMIKALTVEKSGYYVVEDNKIYLLKNKGDSTDNAEWMKFELRGGKLKIIERSDAPDVLSDAYPIVFEEA